MGKIDCMQVMAVETMPITDEGPVLNYDLSDLGLLGAGMKVHANCNPIFFSQN